MLVDDRVITTRSQRVSEGAHVHADLDELEAAAAHAMDAEPDVAVDVIHKDEHLLVIDKPAGLVVHPAPGHDEETLVNRLVGLGAAGGDPGRPGIVHRLDRDTSGLLLVARSERAYEQLSSAIRERQVERRYLALVRGAPRSRAGRIDAAIGRDRTDRTRRSIDTDTPREAVTWFEVRERLGERTLLEVRLETGRTHQIRVHLEAIGLPVSGDPVYGAARDLGLERQFLHAHALAFDHPTTGERLAFASSLPPDLAAALEAARTEA